MLSSVMRNYIICFFLIFFTFQIIPQDYDITNTYTLTLMNGFTIADWEEIGQKFFNIKHNDQLTHALSVVYGEYSQLEKPSYQERIDNLISEEDLEIAAVEHLENFYPEYKDSLQSISVEPRSAGPMDKWIYLYLSDHILVLYASRMFTSSTSNIECYLLSVDINLGLSAQRNLIGDLLVSIRFHSSPKTDDQ